MSGLEIYDRILFSLKLFQDTELIIQYEKNSALRKIQYEKNSVKILSNEDITKLYKHLIR